MSASMRPTWWPSWARATARLAATVDLPTPPLPLATATTWRTSGIRLASWEIAFWADSSRPGGFTTWMLTFTAETPGRARSTRCTSSRTFSPAAGLWVAICRSTATAPARRLHLVHEAEGDDVPAHARELHRLQGVPHLGFEFVFHGRRFLPVETMPLEIVPQRSCLVGLPRLPSSPPAAPGRRAPPPAAAPRRSARACAAGRSRPARSGRRRTPWPCRDGCAALPAARMARVPRMPTGTIGQAALQRQQETAALEGEEGVRRRAGALGKEGDRGPRAQPCRRPRRSSGGPCCGRPVDRDEAAGPQRPAEEGDLEEAPLGHHPHLPGAGGEQHRDVVQALVIGEEDVAAARLEARIVAPLDPHHARRQERRWTRCA